MALVDSLREGYVEHNVPLHLLLGLISLARRMDAHLPPSPEGAPAAHAAGEAPPLAQPVPETPGGDPLLHVLLGLISLRRTLLSELEPLREAHEAAQARPGPEAPGPDAQVALPARDLLR